MVPDSPAFFPRLDLPAEPPRIVLIGGTRPEAVKLAPLVLDLRARGLAPLLVATGQHREMFSAVLGEFGLCADLDMAVTAPTPDAMVGGLLPVLGDRLRALRPAIVVVQGDTSSTLAGALAARYAGARLAHVEAGLRTGSNDPHPEEMHRRLVAQLAELHFAPTHTAAAALAAEGVQTGVHVTGNSGIDALLLMQARLAADPGLAAAAAAPVAHIPATRPWIMATVHRRENHGARLAAVLTALAELAKTAEIIVPVHPGPAVSGPVRAALSGMAGVHLLPPLGYAAFVALMGRAALVLTDSGGVQEEAPALGLPCLVLREGTERPEGVASGNARLVGTSTADIVAATRAILGDANLRARMGRPVLPYGAGGAAAAINCELLRPVLAASARTSESWLQSGGHHRSSRAERR